MIGTSSKLIKRKRAEVFVPDDWVHLIEETNSTKFFVATKMQRVDFHDWKSYTEERYRPILKDNDRERIWLRDIHWMNFGWGEEKRENGEMEMKHHPGEVWVRFGFQRVLSGIPNTEKQMKARGRFGRVLLLF